MSGADKDAPEKSVQDFLQRWSRRKRGTADAENTAPPAPEPPQTGEPQPAPPPPDVAAEPPAAFDPASLPPIESIDASTDIRAFLAPGVPVELSRAALRRAWTSDPTIRDFIGIAENQWDFTNPDAIPGFGALDFKEEEVRAMVSRLFGEEPPTAGAGDPAGPEPSDAPTALTDATSLTPPAPDPSPEGGGECAQLPVNQPSEIHRAAVQNEGEAEKPDFTTRKHGAALPK